jgi:four helix bundle protein
MAEIKSFTDLNTWKTAHELVLKVYLLTRKFPKDEMFGITSQMRRVAVSITSNIAEGFGRHTFKNKVQFYYQSRGSLTELHNQLILSKDLSYISSNEYGEISIILEKSHKLLQGLISNTKSNDRY